MNEPIPATLQSTLSGSRTSFWAICTVVDVVSPAAAVVSVGSSSPLNNWNRRALLMTPNERPPMALTARTRPWPGRLAGERPGAVLETGAPHTPHNGDSWGDSQRRRLDRSLALERAEAGPRRGRRSRTLRRGVRLRIREKLHRWDRTVRPLSRDRKST